MTTVLFFDDWALHDRYNVVRRLGRPRRLPEADWYDPVLNRSPSFVSVYREKDRWRMFYCAVPETEKGDHGSRLFTAESADGVRWEVGERHLVHAGEHSVIGAHVFRDARDSRHPWKVAYADATRGKPPRAAVAVSEDGYSWQVLPQPWGSMNSDTGNNIFFNQHTGRYQIIGRAHHAQRLVASVETPDFRTYDRPRILLRPDPLDPPLLQFYGMPTFAYEGYFVGLLWLQHMDPAERGATRMLGTIDTQLAYSHDGDSFQRTFREPFLSRGDPGEVNSGSTYGFSLLDAGDGSLRLYAGGRVYEHADRPFMDHTGPWHVGPRDPDRGLSRLMAYYLRRDGFVYLEPYAHVGRVETRPFDLTAPTLTINVEAPYGDAAVQLRDLEGNPIPGFTFSEAEVFSHRDETHWQPRWNGGADLKGLVGQAVRVEVRFARGRLYALRIGGTLRDRNRHVHSGA